ncbi:glycosyltransferase family 2 protein [Gluconobacter wancherniae]|uniref:glycosyltransferase family 2 protein n=1 Tax=Gluconobacter wancherniae TaxID=1307955 RepID=UPI001B8D939E|nr:glycosyltransferase family 2 protein [Gluconobacter wancherniae]MBS1095959.1 glycosyltransferase family 2 protein [Gluconobacter wancherniae]
MSNYINLRNNYLYQNEISKFSEKPIDHRKSGNYKYKKSLVACARWENQYIVEWVNYHKSIGFDHIYIYCNDDDPSSLYEKIIPFLSGDNPFITFIHYNLVGLQFQMYFHFLWKYSTENEWIMFFDIDEFLLLRDVNNIDRFIENYNKYDAIYFNWCSFGNNGYETRPEGSVLINYTKREDGATPFTKVLIKTNSIPYKKIYQIPNAPINHDYAGLDENIISCNVLHEDMKNYYENFPDSAWKYLNKNDRRKKILEKGFVAHFNIKSNQDFELRVSRGLSGSFATQKIWGQLTEEQKKSHHAMTNAIEDKYLHNYWQSYVNKAWDHSLFLPSEWTLISKGKKASQSSTEHNRTIEEDAEAVISGEIWARAQNHTKYEKNPWWEVDLIDHCKVHEIRIFNRMDGCLERISNFSILISKDRLTWDEIHRKNDNLIYGGADGSPYIWRNISGYIAKYLKIIIIAPDGGYLHFDQVEIYGQIIS